MFAAYVSVLSALLFDVCEASLVKSNSAISRVIVDSYRTVAAGSFVMLLNLGDIKALTLVLQLLGTFLLVLGNYMYSRGTPTEPAALSASMDSYQLLRTQ